MIDHLILEDLKMIISQFDIDLFKEREIFIAGGAGFLGSWLCDTLSWLGAKIICVDNLSATS